MTCEVITRDGIIRIVGEMTIPAAMTLRDALFDALHDERGCAIIDLAEVSEFDTTGVQILMVAQRMCTARGASFKLANPSAVVRDTLELLRIASLPFSIHHMPST